MTHHTLLDAAGRAEAGTGLIGTAAAVGAFVAFLLFAVQLTLTLYATSTVDAAGYDAARIVASRRVDHADPAAVAAAEGRADARFHALLGRAATYARLTWSLVGASVRLRAEVPVPRALPRTLGGAVGPDEIDRTFVVRLEQA